MSPSYHHDTSPSNHHLPLYNHLLTVLVILASLAIAGVSALSVPAGIAKFDRCANSTYACLSGSSEEGRYNYTVGYCCCFDLWNTCRRTLGCDASGNGGNLAAPSSANHPKKVKGSAESCLYLKNQESKMRREKICPAKLTDCPNGAPPRSSFMNGPGGWTMMALLLVFLSSLY